MVGKALKIFLLCLSISVFTLAFVVFVYRWNLPYENGKYVTTDGIVYADSMVEFAGLLSGIFFLLSCLLVWAVKRK